MFTEGNRSNTLWHWDIATQSRFFPKIESHVFKCEVCLPWKQHHPPLNCGFFSPKILHRWRWNPRFFTIVWCIRSAVLVENGSPQPFVAYSMSYTSSLWSILSSFYCSNCVPILWLVGAWWGLMIPIHKILTVWWRISDSHDHRRTKSC